MAILKYIVLFVALAGVNIAAHAQRQIEWYEPDFDSAYAYHWLLFARIPTIPPHYNSFFSKAAKSRKMKTVRKITRDELASRYFVSETKYDRAGFITSYRECRHLSNGSVDTVQVHDYTWQRKAGRLTITVENKLYHEKATYYFGRAKRIDSIAHNRRPTMCYGYDTTGRLISVSTCDAGRADDRLSTRIVYTDIMDSVNIRSEINKFWPQNAEVAKFSRQNAMPVKFFRIDFAVAEPYNDGKYSAEIAVFRKSLAVKQQVRHQKSLFNYLGVVAFKGTQLDRFIHHDITIRTGLLSGVDSTTATAVAKNGKWFYSEHSDNEYNRVDKKYMNAESIFDRDLSGQIKVNERNVTYEYEFYK